MGIMRVRTARGLLDVSGGPLTLLDLTFHDSRVSLCISDGLWGKCGSTDLHGHHEGQDGQGHKGRRAQLEVEQEHGHEDAQGGGDEAHDALAQQLQHLCVAGDHVEDTAAGVRVAALGRQRQNLVVHLVGER